MNERCLHCKHFYIWDGDPCCMEPTRWKIILPDAIDCKKHESENSEHAIDWVKAWNKAKISFFERYNVSEELKEQYLIYHPEDKDIINKQVIC